MNKCMHTNAHEGGRREGQWGRRVVKGWAVWCRDERNNDGQMIRV